VCYVQALLRPHLQSDGTSVHFRDPVTTYSSFNGAALDIETGEPVMKAPGEDELSFTSRNEEQRRLLIKQFYEESVRRYGVDSVQARMLSPLLSPAH
jgi:hypothetical protein